MATGDARYRTADGGEITAGARLFNVGDFVWVTIDAGQFADGSSLSPGGANWNGWFRARGDDGRTYDLNAERLAVRPPR